MNRVRRELVRWVLLILREHGLNVLILFHENVTQEVHTNRVYYHI